MTTFEESLTNDLRDPELRAEWERTAFARAVANQIVKYRGRNKLTQIQLARRLKMHQSAVARLELGEHEPSIATLARLSKGLGINFHIDITPSSLSLSA
jgi:ribosome-binding protein aMBF1 (putative translation factor)